MNSSQRLFTFFVDNYRFTFLLTALVGLCGIIGLLNLQRESRPPVDFATVEIITPYPGASSADVEDSVTKKIEDELLTIDGIKEVLSVSESGLSTLTIKIEMNSVNVSEVVDEIQRAVQRVQDLPADLPNLPRLERINVKEIPVIELALVGSVSTFERVRLAEDLADLLEDVKGVAEVKFSGLEEREFIIELYAAKMASYDISVAEVLTAVQRHSQNIPAGYVDDGKQSVMVRILGKSSSAENLGDIIVRSNASGTSIKIKDIGKTSDGNEDPSVIVQIDNKPATILTVTKKGRADAVNVVTEVKAQIELFKKRLPSGLGIIIYNDEAKRIENQLQIVISNAVTGLILVLAFLLLFLPGTIGFMTALSLPLSILGTVALMPFFGATFNTITTLAFIIAIGMLVDNAVVISENYASLRTAGVSQKQAAIDSVVQLWVPITATYATTVLAFLPMLVTKGVMGEFIKWIPIVVSLALTASLIESFLLLPARISFTVKKSISPEEDSKKFFSRCRVKFEALVYICVCRRYLITLGICGLLAASVILVMTSARFELFPKDQVEFYYGRFETEQGTSLAETARLGGELAKKVAEKLKDIPPDYIISRAGIQKIGMTDPLSQNGDNVGMITIKYSSEMAAEMSSSQTLSQLREVEQSTLKELSFDLMANGPPVGKALSVTLRSSNEKDLLSIKDKFKEELKSLKGIKDIADNNQANAPEFLVDINEEKMAAAELDLESLGLTLRTGLEGTIASTVSVNNNDVDTRVRFASDSRSRVESLKKYLLRNRNGFTVELGSIARFERQGGPPVLRRRDFRRSLTVTADLDPNITSSVELNRLAKKKLDHLIKDYSGVNYLIGGEQESTQESLSSLKSAMILAGVGILVVLVFLFRSFSSSFLVLSTIPLGLIGVCWAFFLHNRPLSFMAMIGTIGLAGVVVNSAIVLVTFIEELRVSKRGQTLSLDRILAISSAERLRAVLVTSLTTISGLIPTAYGLGGIDSLLMPMTLALAWGLISGTVLSLIWVPCAYAVIQDLKSKFNLRDTSLNN